MSPSLAQRMLILFGIGLIAYSLDVNSTEVPPMNHFQIQAIGSSVEERDIDAYTFGEGEDHIVFIGGIHGGYEANTVQLSYRLIEELQHTTSTILEGTTITVIPVANPDGLYRVLGTTSAFPGDAITQANSDRSAGRFNARNVDLNRNFACNWQEDSTWGMQTVSGGEEAFSEPESSALRDFILKEEPNAVIFFHSKANGVFGSSCDGVRVSDTLELARAYAEASGYPLYETFDTYPITGDAEGYLASIGIPAITVELETHEDMEWERNWKGVMEVVRTITAN